MLKIYPMPLGDFQANCYVITVGQDALIVDPGDEATKIITYIQTKGLNPVAILLTHGHFDHIGALKEVYQQYQVPVYVHTLETDYLIDPTVNLSVAAGKKPIAFDDLSPFTFIDKDKDITLLGEKITVRHVPGHSAGSIAFYFSESSVVFSGDALFKGSIGRTDLLHGNHNQLINSINTQLFTLPDDTIVYSGHGPATTIKDEQETNPFFN